MIVLLLFRIFKLQQLHIVHVARLHFPFITKQQHAFKKAHKDVELSNDSVPLKLQILECSILESYKLVLCRHLHQELIVSQVFRNHIKKKKFSECHSDYYYLNKCDSPRIRFIKTVPIRNFGLENTLARTRAGVLIV